MKKAPILAWSNEYNILHLDRNNQQHEYRMENNWLVAFLLSHGPWDILNHKLSMSQHYRAIVKKANTTLGFLNRSRPFKICEISLLLYSTMVGF